MASITSSWSYLRNMFDNVTKNNYKRMVSMARDLHDKLLRQNANADILVLYNLMLAEFMLFNKSFVAVSNNWALYQSNTLTVENWFKELTRKTKRWEAWVLTEFDDDSSEYLSLMPNGRADFNKGPYEMRLKSVATLETALGAYPTLNTVLLDVQQFRTDIEAARTTQQGFEQNDKQLRQDLEHARLDLAVAMHRVFGGLIQLYAHDTAHIETFFDMRYLQSTSTKRDKKAAVRTVSANSRSKVLERVFVDNDILQLSNVGNVSLGFFVTNDENAATPNDITLLDAQESQSYTLSDLSDGTTNPHFLMVVNMNDEIGRYQAVLIEENA